VHLDPVEGGFKISKSALTLTASVPGLDQETFDKLAEAAEKGCPVSKVLNAEITLTKTLV
jgi:osmotically inducible protein OsmC